MAAPSQPGVGATPRPTASDAGRSLDLLLATILLVVTAPVMIAIAVWIRLRMGSPVLFRQERAGKQGRIFRMAKFRTMRAPRPSEEGFRPDTDEQRLTSLGRWLRATSLDELPTLLNVARGDMSLVGPRPLPVHYLARYSDDHARRHEVRPGVTGWAQVNGRNGLSWDDQLDMDVWYVDNQSLGLDLRILGRTVATVLRREGISQQGQATREEFPGSSAAQPGSGNQQSRQATTP